MKSITNAPFHRPSPTLVSYVKRLALTLFAIIFAFCTTGCGRDEKTALEEFKKDMTALQAWSKEKEKSFAGNPLGPLAAMGELTIKSKAIKTDGLPADLKEAWKQNLAAMDKMSAAMGQLPANPEEAQKKMADPAFQKDFGAKMAAVQPDVMAASTKMDEMATKYGFESLGKK